MPDGGVEMNLKQAYTDSLRIVWAVCCVIRGVAFLLSFLTEHYDLDRALSTTQGLKSEDGSRTKEHEFLTYSALVITFYCPI